MSWVIDNSRHKGSSLVVLLMIANCADRDGQNAYPGFEKLARDSRITIRQITNIIPILERSGEVIVERGKGPNGTNRYTLNMRQSRLPLEKIANGKVQAADFQRSVRNQKIEPTTPLPPADAGDDEFVFRFGHGQIAVRMGRRMRLPNLSAYQGTFYLQDVANFLTRKGFPARVVVEGTPDRVVA